MAIDINPIVDRALPTEALVCRFPSLREISVAHADVVKRYSDELSERPALDENPPFSSVEAEAMREAVDFYELVVKDGRYVSLLATDPKAAANLLGADVSDEVISNLSKLREGMFLRCTSEQMGLYAGIAATIVIGVFLGIVGGKLVTVVMNPRPNPDPGSGPDPGPDPGPDGGDGFRMVGEGKHANDLSSGTASPIGRGFVFLDHSGLAKL
jgi:hypothetical protein